ncbi:DUF2599 domain-containing protein [Streptomyces sp. DSM 41527]|uniref:DUF2599 domain-containing protein n=1 Tax=Streptomyces mooreae TaxID=3075523 RepID=A0ABU2TIX4_9ACTN|nr:DUF2599 domain-containing protein [Streptomyces sp. DSM 41527]MDT0460897.1 DUF2599 domain-containing protein [Streptomyces sp. DSM 41527]
MGKIGELWADFGWERGDFGYPTSDEVWSDPVNGYLQSFSTDDSLLWWSRGFPDEHANHPVCKGECVGYKAKTNTEWVDKTEVARSLVNGNVDVSVIPTAAGFDSADTSYDRLWNETFSKVPYPADWLTAEQGSSAYKQLSCHARYAYAIPGGGHTSGDSWDLETWAPDVSWDYAMNLLSVAIHQCNWYDK